MVGVRVIARLEFRWVGAVWKAWVGVVRVGSDKNCQVLTWGGGFLFFDQCVSVCEGR
jgi:hypothetical protein